MKPKLEDLAGFVDLLGCARCVHCAVAFDYTSEGTYIYRGATHSDEPCDACQQTINDWPDRDPDPKWRQPEKLMEFRKLYESGRHRLTHPKGSP